jgi:hypothetical protein
MLGILQYLIRSSPCQAQSLYCRLGGYHAIAAVSENLAGGLMADRQPGRFWAHRSEDGLKRELQLPVDFLSNDNIVAAWCVT